MNYFNFFNKNKTFIVSFVTIAWITTTMRIKVYRRKEINENKMMIKKKRKRKEKREREREQENKI